MKKKTIKRAEERARNWAARFLAKALYLTGLTMLIPFFPLIFRPDKLMLRIVQGGTFFTGAVFIAVSVTIIIKTYKPARALKVLGTFTLIPSFIALSYAIVGPELVDTIVRSLGPASPVIDNWLAFNNPRALTIAVFYFILGFALRLSSQFWHTPAASTR